MRIYIYIYQLFSQLTFELNFFMKLDEHDTLIMEIISSKFHQEIHQFTPSKVPINTKWSLNLILTGNVLII